MQKSTSPIEYRRQLRVRIIETAQHEFYKHGVVAVKMDDIAKILSISKRTMYEIFTNKEELFLETSKKEFYEFDRHMSLYFEQNRNVIDNILEFYRIKMRNICSMSPSYFSDLHKFPRVTEWFRKQNEERQVVHQRFFEEGIRQGFFRNDIDYKLMSEIGNAAMDYIMSHQLYKRYSIVHLHRNVVMIFLRGICTIKGLETFDEKLTSVFDDEEKA
ncbi:MAG: TetR/AcrR family transcriptional regulator [Prevotella sp.]|jgi:AcrR family transcriptional regulator